MQNALLVSIAWCPKINGDDIVENILKRTAQKSPNESFDSFEP